MKQEEYLLTDLEIVLPVKNNDVISYIEMDLLAKTVLINGLPYIGYFVKAKDSLDVTEPVAIDLSDYQLWSHETSDAYELINDEMVQKFSYTIFRNKKEFYSAEFTTLKSCDNALEKMLNRLKVPNKRIDYRRKNFMKDILGKTFKINAVDVTVLEYIDGKNLLNVRYGKDDKITQINALTLNV